MTVEKLAKTCQCSKSWIYKLCKDYGRLPTIEEVKQRKNKCGRPQKYIEKKGE